MGGSQWLYLADSFTNNPGDLHNRPIETVRGPYAGLIGSDFRWVENYSIDPRINATLVEDGYARMSGLYTDANFSIGANIPPTEASTGAQTVRRLGKNFANQVDIGSSYIGGPTGTTAGGIYVAGAFVLNTASPLTLSGMPTLPDANTYLAAVGVSTGQPLITEFATGLSAAAEAKVDSWGGEFTLLQMLVIGGTSTDSDFFGALSEGTAGFNINLLYPPSGTSVLNVRFYFVNGRFVLGYTPTDVGFAYEFDSVAETSSVFWQSTVGSQSSNYTVDVDQIDALDRIGEYYATFPAIAISYNGYTVGPQNERHWPRLLDWNCSWGFSGGWKVGAM